MASEQMIMSQSGKPALPLACSPRLSAIPITPMDMNFCPSWAPCRKARMQARMLVMWVQMRLPRARRMRMNSRSIILVMRQPRPKPATSENTRP